MVEPLDYKLVEIKSPIKIAFSIVNLDPKERYVALESLALQWQYAFSQITLADTLSWGKEWYDAKKVTLFINSLVDDCLWWSPLIKALSLQVDELNIVTMPECKPLFEGHPYIKRIYTYPVDVRLLSDTAWVNPMILPDKLEHGNIVEQYAKAVAPDLVLQDKNLICRPLASAVDYWAKWRQGQFPLQRQGKTVSYNGKPIVLFALGAIQNQAKSLLPEYIFAMAQNFTQYYCPIVVGTLEQDVAMQVPHNGKMDYDCFVTDDVVYVSDLTFDSYMALVAIADIVISPDTLIAQLGMTWNKRVIVYGIGERILDKYGDKCDCIVEGGVCEKSEGCHTNTCTDGATTYCRLMAQKDWRYWLQQVQRRLLPKMSLSWTHDTNVILPDHPQEDGMISEPEMRTLAGFAQGCKRILEIGTFRGDTTKVLLRYLRKGGAVITVNLEEVPADYPRDHEINYIAQQHYRYLDEPGCELLQTMRLDAGHHLLRYMVDDKQLNQIIGDSRSLDFEKLGNFDLIFVDGCHRYDGVRIDTENALKIVAPGGVIVWHDYQPDWQGVMQWMNEMVVAGYQINRIEGTTMCYWRNS